MNKFKLKEEIDIEIWKHINGAKDCYMISNHGNVQLETQITNGNFDSDGYLTTSIGFQNGKRKQFKIHRLVAEYFVPLNKDLNLTVDHKDENKQNNYYKNLQWLSGANNNRKSNCISIVQCTLNGEFIKFFDSAKDAGKELNFCKQNINGAVNGKRTLAYNYLWITKYNYKNNPKIIKEKVKNYNDRWNKSAQNRIIDYSILKLDKNTNEIIEIIESIVEYEPNAIRRGNIKKVCQSTGRNKTAFGYKWKFKHNETN